MILPVDRHSAFWAMPRQEILLLYGTFLIHRRLYTWRSRYAAETRCLAGVARLAGSQNPFSPFPPAWVRHYVGHSGHFRRRTPRGGGLPLPRVAPHGRVRLDPRGMGHQG